MMGLYRNIHIAVLAVVLTVAAFGTGVYGAVKLNPGSLSAAATEAYIPIKISLPESALLAKAAVIYDMRTNRVLYQKNANEQLPLASLTKLMAVETVLSVKTPDTPVQITGKDPRTEGDSGFKAGQTVTLGDLIKFSLVASSNDAIEAAANSLGTDAITKMNEAAKTLGLTQTHFFNATGLDVTSKTSGAYGSAYDVARLAAVFYKDHPDFFELTTKPEVSIEQNGKTLTAEATMAPIQHIQGFVAAKTGYTDLAGGNLVAIFDLEPGLTVSAAVLGSTREGRFTDMETLITAAKKSL